MAKAKPVPALDPLAETRYSLAAIFSVRISELWSWAPHMHYPERVHELHDMRIAAKRLRYCFEFFQPCFGHHYKSTLERFKKLQEYLGEIHDCDVWVDYLRVELKAALQSDARAGRRLGKHIGAVAPLAADAAALGAELAGGNAQGLLQLILDVCARRQVLYNELLAFWDKLEQRDFRGELLKLVAAGVATAGPKLYQLEDVEAGGRHGRTTMERQSTVDVDPDTDGEVRASLDIGSNSVKLLVARVRPGQPLEVLADRNTVTGLGRGVSASGELDAAAVEHTLGVLRGLVVEARALGAEQISAAGTAALRSASNPELLTAPLAAELGVQVRILSGEEEAQLARLAVLRELPADKKDAMLFDTGGGSTELTWVHRGEVKAGASVDIGARRCTEQAGITHPVQAEQHQRLVELIRSRIDALAPVVEAAAPFMAGPGGTASVLVWIEQGQRGLPPGDPHGAVLTVDTLRGWQARLAPLTPDEVRALPNLDPLRADIIYAGITIILLLLEHYSASEFTVIDRGLRYGLLLA
jgi:exopolyphosphatase/guanosine-5'-triphosphate,3'-diphosphate pyrophosphatase